MHYQKRHIEALMDAVRVHLVAWDSSESLRRGLVQFKENQRSEQLSITAQELRLALRLLEKE